MRRALGIPAAIAVLVTFPVVIGQASEPEKPAAKEGALTINLEGDQGGGDPYAFQVTADGPAPTKAAILHDASGLNVGTVAPASGCTGQARVVFPATSQPWCLQLEKVATGHELSGAIEATPTATVGPRQLKLTVNRRDAFLGWPLLVIVLGFVVAAAGVLFKSALRKPVRRGVLGDLLRDNAAASGEARIEELTEFARARLAEGEEIDDLIKKVAGVRQNGPGAASAARTELAEALKAAGAAIEKLPLSSVAAKEAARTDNRMSDFYAGADPVPHPATELAKVVAELAEQVAYAQKLRTAIEGLPAAERVEPTEALARAELVIGEATSLDDARRVAGLLTAARDSVETARVKSAVRPLASRRRDGEPAPGAAPLEAAPAAPLPLGAAELGGDDLGKTRLLAAAMTLLAIVATLLLAGFTVTEAVYEPKLAFASFSDYFALFSAALVSSAAGSVLVLLGLWSPIPAEE